MLLALVRHSVLTFVNRRMAVLSQDAYKKCMDAGAGSSAGMNSDSRHEDCVLMH